MADDQANTTENELQPSESPAKDENDEALAAPEKSDKQLIITYIVVIVGILAECAATIFVQLLGDVVPEMELNAYRFYMLALLSLPLLACNKCDLRIAKSLWFPVFCCIALFCLINLTYYGAIFYLPVGNIGAFTAAVSILCSLFLAVILQRERSITVWIAGLLCLTGIVLVTRPFVIFGYLEWPRSNWKSSCFAEDEDKKHNFSQVGAIHTVNISEATKNATTVNKERARNELLGVSPEIFGYILLTTCGCSMAVIYQLIHKIGTEISSSTLMFYVGVVCCTVCCCISFATQPAVNAAANTAAFFNLPTSTYCITMFVLHVICAAVATATMIICMPHLPQVSYSLIMSLVIVFLLVAQNTFMKDIRPGFADWVEVVGGVMCFSGSILSPLSEVCKSLIRWKANYKDI